MMEASPRSHREVITPAGTVTTSLSHSGTNTIRKERFYNVNSKWPFLVIRRVLMSRKLLLSVWSPRAFLTVTLASLYDIWEVDQRGCPRILCFKKIRENSVCFPSAGIDYFSA